MADRVLRLAEGSVEVDLHDKQSVQSIAMAQREHNELVASKVDRYAFVEKRIEALTARNKAELSSLNKELKTLAKELVDLAQEGQTKKLIGSAEVLNFETDVSRSIDPKAFAEFLAENGRESDLWNFVTVGLRKVFDEFGEKVLERAGVIRYQSDEYGKLKVTPASPLQ